MTMSGVALARMALAGVTAVRVPGTDVVTYVPGVSAAQKHLRQKAEETDQKQCRTD